MSKELLASEKGWNPHSYAETFSKSVALLNKNKSHKKDTKQRIIQKHKENNKKTKILKYSRKIMFFFYLS